MDSGLEARKDSERDILTIFGYFDYFEVFNISKVRVMKGIICRAYSFLKTLNFFDCLKFKVEMFLHYLFRPYFVDLHYFLIFDVNEEKINQPRRFVS